MACTPHTHNLRIGHGWHMDESWSFATPLEGRLAFVIASSSSTRPPPSFSIAFQPANPSPGVGQFPTQRGTNAFRFIVDPVAAEFVLLDARRDHEDEVVSTVGLRPTERLVQAVSCDKYLVFNGDCLLLSLCLDGHEHCRHGRGLTLRSTRTIDRRLPLSIGNGVYLDFHVPLPDRSPLFVYVVDGAGHRVTERLPVLVGRNQLLIDCAGGDDQPSEEEQPVVIAVLRHGVQLRDMHAARLPRNSLGALRVEFEGEGVVCDTSLVRQ